MYVEDLETVKRFIEKVHKARPKERLTKKWKYRYMAVHSQYGNESKNTQ
jgi:hypothetical protein